MSITITGGYGFLGWHTACRIRALEGVEPHRLGRSELTAARESSNGLGSQIIHIAGVNRAASPEDVAQGNVVAAQHVAEAIRNADKPVDLSYANSIQADLDNPYGEGKRKAAEILAQAVHAVGGSFCDVLLPNIFGEHGRPNYNSFVATFAHSVAAGTTPNVTADNRVPLLHVQDAAAALIDGLGVEQQVRPAGEAHGVQEVAERLQAFHALYDVRGEIPPLPDKFSVNLFNTYRAAAWPGNFPIRPQVHADNRGELFETVRAHGGTGQAFVSTTRPGQLRGDHYHLHKVERFFVVKGTAEIQLRRLLHEEVVTFRLSGETPSFVDMPTLWVHNIRNVGNDELLTMFWADQLLDPASPDQYPERVMLG